MASTTAAQDKLRKILAFTTTDHFGNEVICTQKTWGGHVSKDHPEMAARQDEVKTALADPKAIHPSTISGSAFLFHSETADKAFDFRVVVTYDDPNLLVSGATIGKISTTYPVDEVIYDTPHMGDAIYTRTAQTSADTDSDTEEGGDV